MLFTRRLFTRFARFTAIAPLVCAPLLATALALSAPAAAVAAATTGSGKTATESRTVGEFQAITSAASIDVRVKQGPQAPLQLQGDDNLLALLETVVENTANGATLVVRWKSGTSIYNRSRMQLSVVVPRLSAFTLTGSGDAAIEAFNTPSLKLTVSGSGDIKVPGLTTDELQVSVAGSGDVGGAGKATRVKVTVAGSGDVRLGDMKADDVSVSVAGSGDVAVHADKSLDVKVAGSGDVVYSGAAVVKKSVAGSGSVNKK
jgi:hypothetical protein